MVAQKALNLTPAELEERRNAGELWQSLDVRERWEIELASIVGAIWIPMRELPGRLDELDAGQHLAVVCHSGVRSARVADWLASSEFTSVANVQGGIDAWSIEIDATIPRY